MSWKCIKGTRERSGALPGSFRVGEVRRIRFVLLRNIPWSAASIQQSSIALLMLIGAALNGGLEFAGVVAVWFAVDSRSWEITEGMQTKTYSERIMKNPTPQLRLVSLLSLILLACLAINRHYTH